MPKILQMSKDIHEAIQPLMRSDPELYSELQNIIKKHTHSQYEGCQTLQTNTELPESRAKK